MGSPSIAIARSAAILSHNVPSTQGLQMNEEEFEMLIGPSGFSVAPGRGGKSGHANTIILCAAR